MVTRYNSMEDQPAPQSSLGVDTSGLNEPISRVAQGTFKLTAGSAEGVNQAGFARHSVSFDGSVGGTILASLQQTTGKPSVELVPGVPMSRTSVESAIKMGYLQRDSAGNLQEVARHASDAEAGQQPEAPQPQDTQANPDAAHFDAEDDQLWQEDIGPLSQPGYDGAVASTIGALVRGEDLEGAVRGLVQAEGMEPAMAREYVEQGIAKEQRVVDRLAASMSIHGDQLEAFYESVRQNPRKLQDALQRHMHARDLSGWRELALDFKARNTDVSMYHLAGLETHVDRQTAEVMVRRPGGAWVNASNLSKE